SLGTVQLIRTSGGLLASPLPEPVGGMKILSPTPESFSGDTDCVKGFLLQCSLAIACSPSVFPCDVLKLSFFFKFIKRESPLVSSGILVGGVKQQSLPRLVLPVTICMKQDTFTSQTLIHCTKRSIFVPVY
uniref:Uncharacterized protein n=1 Tax=Amphilophus citrinellus TaxID=61819 RepID=A0A3Q0SYS6_AMPCI